MMVALEYDREPFGGLAHDIPVIAHSIVGGLVIGGNALNEASQLGNIGIGSASNLHQKGPRLDSSKTTSMSLRSLRMDFRAASRAISKSRSSQGDSLPRIASTSAGTSALAMRHWKATFSIPSPRSRLSVSKVP